MKKDLLTVLDLAPKDIDNILKRAAALKKMLRRGKARPTLKGKTLGMIFEKSSTRTMPFASAHASTSRCW